MRSRLFGALIVFAAIAAPLQAADILVPSLDLITRGYLSNGSFILSTHAGVDIDVTGGSLFKGKVSFGFEADDLENASIDRSLQFSGAEVEILNLFGAPISVSYFTGKNDVLGSGDIFPDYFGSKPIATKYSGYLYFPDPNQIRYDGISTVNGTGLSLNTTFGTKWDLTDLYVYQDAYLGTGHYSADLRTAMNFNRFKMEAFVGGSYPASQYGYYRAGLLLYYDTGQGGEFLTQIGIPRWDPSKDPFNIDLFYFLFEPRVHFGGFSIILTLFWHPEYYLQEPTNELGTANINANFQFGNPDKNPASGGIEANGSIDTAGTQQFQVTVSPYLGVNTAGILWTFKVNASVVPFSLDSLVDVFVGAKAQF